MIGTAIQELLPDPSFPLEAKTHGDPFRNMIEGRWARIHPMHFVGIERFTEHRYAQSQNVAVLQSIP
jgi:hypothetical protein